MKEDFTKFTCDHCARKTTKTKNTGYPYEKGWYYIYNFTAKTDLTRLEEKDKHFCCENCLIY
jgi:hypothetical protein